MRKFILPLICIGFFNSCSNESDKKVSLAADETKNQVSAKIGDIYCHKVTVGVNILVAFFETDLFVCCTETVGPPRPNSIGKYHCIFALDDLTYSIGSRSYVETSYSDLKKNLNIDEDFEDIDISTSSEYVNERGEVFEVFPGNYLVDRENNRIILEMIRIR
jgi:hypothetical protein